MPYIDLPYQLHPTGLLPLCEVVILGKDRRVPVQAVVDSGATHPFFPVSAAEDAGIDLTAAPRMNVTFGGSVTEGRSANVYVEIQRQRLMIRIVFVDDIKLGYALLGRDTVFNQFNEVAFLERTKVKRVQLRG